MPAPPITIATPLPPEDLRFESMSYGSGLSSLGEMQVVVTSERNDITSDDLLGQPVSIQVLRRDESPRFFNGIVSRFGVGQHLGRHFTYQLTVRPWLWFLTRTSDCRIFQDMTVPDIVKAVFGDHEIATFKMSLFRTYRKWVYCVQYRESDFNFVARLMEQEGIYWYFEHEEGQHVLHLVDSLSSHDAVPGYETLPYFPNVESIPPDLDYATRWHSFHAVETGSTVERSYDFERPSTKLEAVAKRKRSYHLSDREDFDWQGDWVKSEHGTQWNGDRLDEIQSRHATASGLSNSQGLTVGHLFTLEKHPHDALNIEYLVVQTSVRARVAPNESGGDSGEYMCDFTAMPAEQQFRAPRTTRKPFVQGPQTAVVVGPAGEEIFTDKYGRVKVQFFWDRLGQHDESSSCWMRVSHPWAGKNFGMIHTPRIGQEVVVDFLEGDPDQPLITGRVYNAEQMPPWELPANATQSGILTRSSKGGAVANANALRFEDKKGAEQVWLHAEKNQDIEVENDETHWVGHDRTKTIDHDETSHIKHDRTETVDNNETITVHGFRTETVEKDESITIHMNRNEQVGKNESISIGSNRIETVGSNESISIGNNRSESVSGNESVTVGKDRKMDVADNETLTVGKNRKHQVGKDETIDIGGLLAHTVAKSLDLKVGEARSTSIGKDDKLQVGKKFFLEAGDEITLKTGDASIVMKKDGTIQIKGKDITITGSGKIGVKASSDLALKGSKIGEN